MLSSLRIVALILCLAVAGLAENAGAQSQPFEFSLAVGPTRAFRGVDAPGVQALGGIEYRLAHGFGVRLEGTSHWYAEQDLYPCMVQDADRCYQTMRRSVRAGTLSAIYHLSRFATDNAQTVPYLITGAGIYDSRRLATAYPSCQPPNECADRQTYKLELRDSQFGWSGGVGLDFRIASVAAFSEMRVHYIYRNTPGGQPSNDYFLWPFSFGLRF
jgi:hypothetical protein